MLSDAKKREQQRKKARRTEERAEGMASAPLTGIHCLPYETLFAIFTFLRIPDLVRCAAVCKQWHDIVTGFTRLWKGKRYTSDRSPRESVEVYAVLRVLPPLREVVVKTGEFCIEVSYPSLSLTVRDVPDTGPAEDGPRPELCQNLREVGVFAQFLLEDHLDTSEGIGRLRVLNIECPWLKELTFLRRYSDVLQELELKACYDLPSAAYAGLGQLGNLQRLFLFDSRVAVADLEVAAKGMRRLASLRLAFCDVSDLSCLRHCERLRELCVEESRPDAPLTGLRDLPAGLCSLHLDVKVVAADELSEAAAWLPLLEKLCLGTCELAHLDFLRHCPRLRRLSLVFSHWPDSSQLSELRHLTRLEVLDLEVAVKGMRRLASLHLDRCYLVSDLSCLRHCERLRELCIEEWPPDAPLTGLRDLPAGLRSLDLDEVAVAADELSEAAARLPLLENLRLGACQLAHLHFLCLCPRLRRLSLEFSHWPDTSQLSNLRHLARLESLDLEGCSVDADVLSGALPSMTRLHTLSLSYADVAHLRFLRQCAQLHTLLLCGIFGLEEDAYRELSHLTNLQTLDVSFDVCEFVREVVQPWRPKLEIYCSEQF